MQVNFPSVNMYDNNSNSLYETEKEQGLMEKDDFLKLFLASLKHQDPMSPMEPNDMMQQMSQLTLIEQITNMSKVVDQLKEVVNGTPLERGVEFLGKSVTAELSDGSEITGKVEEVIMNKGLMELIVNNKTITVGSINRVKD